MNPLQAVFGSYGILPGDALRAAEAFRQISLKKGEFFLQEGHVQDKAGFLVLGWAHFFSLTEQGDSVTTYFAGPGRFIASLSSFLFRAPARESIRMATDAVLLEISGDAFRRMRTEIPGFDRLYVSLLEYQISCIETSRFDMISLSPAERYRKLLREDPELTGLMSVQDLASLLGITPRHLSRLRKPGR